MTEWTDYQVDIAEEIEQTLSDRWSDLWEFNGGVEPKFWFGDRVDILGLPATILGMEWLENKISKERGGQMENGWWYLLLVEGEDSLPYVHGSQLKAIAQTQENLTRDRSND